MQIPREQRDNRWLVEFQDAAWNASIVLPTEPVFLGPDGMPYVRLELPPIGLRQFPAHIGVNQIRLGRPQRSEIRGIGERAILNANLFLFGEVP